MIKKDDYCSACGHKLRTRENDASILLVCTNPTCENYWVKRNAEITMVLK